MTLVPGLTFNIPTPCEIENPDAANKQNKLLSDLCNNNYEIF